jgi:hypothetical protein
MYIAGINVFNDIDILKCSLPACYDKYDKIIIVEGAARLGPDGRASNAHMRQFMTPGHMSTDGTTEFIKSFPDPENKIYFFQKRLRDVQGSARVFINRIKRLHHWPFPFALNLNIPYAIALDLFGPGHWYGPWDADFLMHDSVFKQIKEISSSNENLKEIIVATYDFHYWPHVIQPGREMPFLIRLENNACLSPNWRHYLPDNKQSFKSVRFGEGLFHYPLMQTSSALNRKMWQLNAAYATSWHLKIRDILKHGDAKKVLSQMNARQRDFTIQTLKKCRLFKNAKALHPMEISKHPVWEDWITWFDEAYAQSCLADL